MTRPVYRLGQGGDYQPRGVNLRARAAFLNAVALVVPDALPELRTVDPEDASAVRAWCQRRGFTAASSSDDWLRQTARVTAIYLREKTSGDPDRFQFVFRTPAASIPIPDWPIFTEPEKALVARIKQMREDVARRPDLERVKRISASSRAFEWLALYQVAGCTFAEIAKRGDNARARRARFVTPEAVRERVRRLAADVGIALRRQTRGRPKKQTRLR